MQDFNTEKNKLYKFFDLIFGRADQKFKDELIDNSQATSEEELLNAVNMAQSPYTFNGTIQTQAISYEQLFRNKKQKVDKLREMADYSDISQALDWVCNDTIVFDSDGKTVQFKVLDETIREEDRVRLKQVADYILNDVLVVDKTLWGYCKKYLIEGEIFLEKILNSDKNSIIGVKNVPSYIIVPRYESNIIKEFIQLGIDKQGDFKSKEKTFSDNQIAYVHWDEYVDGDITNPKSYLWYAIRPYNMLKAIEDSLLTYRITRSIERRVFNIEVGNMPTGKAKEFMQKLISQHRKTQTFDSTTGQINQTRNLMSFNEDFWFERRQGQGSEVKNLESGMNLGELRDVDYFQKKLYKALRIPKSRWDEVKQAVYNPGRTVEIERDELDFAAFVTRIQNRLKRLFLDLFITELQLRGFDRQFLDPRLYDFSYSRIDYLAAYKEMDLLENRATMLNLFSTYMASEATPQGILSREFVMKNYFKMDDDEYATNEILLNKEKEELQEKQFFDSIQTNQTDIGLNPDEIGSDGESNSVPIGDDVTLFDLYGDENDPDSQDKPKSDK